MMARVSPLILLVASIGTTAYLLALFTAPQGPADLPWWATLFLIMLGVAVTALAIAVTIDPRPPALRRALAGAGLGWMAIMAGTALIAGSANRGLAADRVLLVAAAATGIALWVLAATTPSTDDDPMPVGARLGSVIAFAVAIVISAAAAVVVVDIAIRLIRVVLGGEAAERLPWVAVVAVIVVPLLAFGVATIDSRRAAGGTFVAQAAANRRNSVLLLVTLVGVVAATSEIIAVTLTLDPIPGLWVAFLAGIVGVGAAVGANRFGASVILGTSDAHEADPIADRMLVDVVRELSIAANIPMPRVYVVPDGSKNAFATGRDPEHASIAVTRGLADHMDREELQGVIGHELGHIRNLDTRYALYIAVLVGIVALVTDGFLRMVIEGWRNGAFIWKSDDKSAAATLAMGLAVGLFLLIVAALLRLLAPLFSLLVQAASSREREYLADATSVEFTRNPRALERALNDIASDTDPLDRANRGTQHLWFRNPVKAGSDRRAGLLSTHPSIGARIDRLRKLQGLDPLDPGSAEVVSAET
jgi:heat shock protein HtpX